MNWLQMPSGDLVNFDGAISLTQSVATIVVTYGTGRVIQLPYKSATAAAAALGVLLEQISSPFNGPVTTSLLSPSSGTHTFPQVSVLIGNGFALDLITPGTLGSNIVIGVDTLTNGGGNLTYVNNQTILCQWTPTNAGTFDVIYTDVYGGVHTLVGGFVAT